MTAGVRTHKKIEGPVDRMSVTVEPETPVIIKNQMDSILRVTSANEKISKTVTVKSDVHLIQL